ncbi:nucleoside hydrolase [Gordonia sp. C13]|uniref:nucleoside hydrolase n=1 Tax=Gordonia sp. C13 TaxID=2935078 RepID=UPI00200B05D1|nr:nucleoside hydrolase [Gordonia sp. C13]MCK8616601.1 nucleoside hydrolase [Gordonia sp. C13]
MMYDGDSRVFFLDCDPGIDDALALAYLLARRTPLVGVGSVAGNVDAARGAENARRLLRLFDRGDIPVSVGIDAPDGAHVDDTAASFHGRNGLGGVSLPPGLDDVGSSSTPDTLRSLARTYGDRLHIIATGPLTNLAQVLADDPDFGNRVGSMTVMGGAFSVPGNVTPWAEANIASDPTAAALVVQSDWNRLTFVPIDLTYTHLFSRKDQTAVRDLDRPELETLCHIVDFYYNAYQDRFLGRYIPLHDPLAAAVAVGDVVVETATRGQVTVCVDRGERRGQTTLSHTTDGKITVVSTVDRQCARVLIDTLAAHWR